MKRHTSNFINKAQLHAFMADIIRKPWTDTAKLERIVNYVEREAGQELPAESCTMIRNSESPTGLRCSVCNGDIHHDSSYCRHCGSKVSQGSPKQRLMRLIDEMPPHEGKTFEEALADWLIENGATLPKEDK